MCRLGRSSFSSVRFLIDSAWIYKVNMSFLSCAIICRSLCVLVIFTSLLCCTRSNNLDHLPSSKYLSILQFIFGLKFVFLFSSCRAAVSIIKIQAIIADKHGRWSLRDRSICSPFQNNETIFTKSLEALLGNTISHLQYFILETLQNVSRKL